MSNLLLDVTDILGAAWTISRGTMASANHVALAPDGSNTAFSLDDQSGIAVAVRSQPVAVAADTTVYCLSVYVPKALSATHYPVLDMRVGSDFDSPARFANLCIDVVNGTAAARPGAGPDTFGIQSFDANYWLVWMTMANSNQGLVFAGLGPAYNTDATGNFNAGASGLTVFATPYLNTGTMPDVLARHDYTITGTVSGTASITGSVVFTQHHYDITGTVSGAASLTGSVARLPRPLHEVRILDSALTMRVGQPFAHTFSAAGRVTDWYADGLPAGTALERRTGRLSGTPAAAGDYGVSVSARNEDNGDSRTIAVTVLPNPPAVAGSVLPNGLVGAAYSHALSATGEVTAVSVSGLPPGLTLDPATWVVSGTPSAAGTYTVRVVAAGPGGSNARVDTVVVTQSTWHMVETVPDTHQAPPSGAGTYAAAGLPGWLSLNTATGVISGTAPKGSAGTYDVTLTFGGVQQEVLRVRVTVLPGPPPVYRGSGIGGGLRFSTVRDNALR